MEGAGEAETKKEVRSGKPGTWLSVELGEESGATTGAAR